MMINFGEGTLSKSRKKGFVKYQSYPKISKVNLMNFHHSILQPSFQESPPIFRLIIQKGPIKWRSKLRTLIFGYLWYSLTKSKCGNECQWKNTCLVNTETWTYPKKTPQDPKSINKLSCWLCRSAGEPKGLTLAPAPAASGYDHHHVGPIKWGPQTLTSQCLRAELKNM